jgi:hypothetical protein
MLSPGVIARIGLASAILLCGVNLTLLASAAWNARNIEHNRSIQPGVADTLEPSSPHFISIAEQRGALASQR